MMRHEFEALVGGEVDPEEYEHVIEIVYMHHPCIQDKKDIANLYKRPNGILIIEDMLERAKAYRDVENKLQKARDKVQLFANELSELKTPGVFIEK